MLEFKYGLGCWRSNRGGDVGVQIGVGMLEFK